MTHQLRDFCPTDVFPDVNCATASASTSSMKATLNTCAIRGESQTESQWTANRLPLNPARNSMRLRAHLQCILHLLYSTQKRKIKQNKKKEKWRRKPQRSRRHVPQLLLLLLLQLATGYAQSLLQGAESEHECEWDRGSGRERARYRCRAPCCFNAMDQPLCRQFMFCSAFAFQWASANNWEREWESERARVFPVWLKLCAPVDGVWLLRSLVWATLC